MFKKFIILSICSMLLIGCAKKEAPAFSKDPNNLSGDVEVMIKNQNPRSIFNFVAFLDGEKYGEFYAYSRDSVSLTMQTQFFANGPHTMVVTKRIFPTDFNVANFYKANVVFNNELSNITLDHGYTLDKDFHFSAISSSPSANYTVEVNDFFNGDVRVYEKSFTGDINAVIPPEVFSTDNQNYKLTVRDSSGDVKFKKTLSRKYIAQMKKENQK